MIHCHRRGFLALSCLLNGLVACSQLPPLEPSASPPLPSTVAADVPAASPTPAGATSSADLTLLFSRIWQVTAAPLQPAAGSIYIFLANGTLLETSCAEPYRIATWTVDKATPRQLQVTEDGVLAYTAVITELSDTTLQLQQNLVRSNEEQEVTLTAVDQEFVCPDLPR